MNSGLLVPFAQQPQAVCRACSHHGPDTATTVLVGTIIWHAQSPLRTAASSPMLLQRKSSRHRDHGRGLHVHSLLLVGCVT
jgi:hypothetical protein